MANADNRCQCARLPPEDHRSSLLRPGIVGLVTYRTQSFRLALSALAVTHQHRSQARVVLVGVAIASPPLYPCVLLAQKSCGTTRGEGERARIVRLRSSPVTWCGEGVHT